MTRSLYHILPHLSFTNPMRYTQVSKNRKIIDYNKNVAGILVNSLQVEYLIVKLCYLKSDLFCFWFSKKGITCTNIILDQTTVV